MKTLENYQQHATGDKEQTMTMDQAFEAEAFTGPEDDDDQDEDDDDFPSGEDLEYDGDDPGLAQDDDDDPDFNADDEEEEFY